MTHIETPLAAARAAREYVLVTAFLWEAVLRGSVSIEQLAESFPLDEHNVAVWPTRTQEYLRTWVWNIFLSSFAISAQGVDHALDDAFGPKPKGAPAKMCDLDATRTVVYMIRCAFAHNPFNPQWKVKAAYRGLFRIREIGLELDTTRLHGIDLDVAQLGGPIAYVKLLNLCVKFLKQSPDQAHDVGDRTEQE